MPRPDLLALTDDDLATLANRGVVKRARRELEAGEPRFELEESADGEVACRWSDGIACIFPASRTVSDARCSSGVPGVTRHVVRSVMAYQQHHGSRTAASASSVAAESAESEIGVPATPVEPTAWCPGEAADTVLEQRFGATAVAAARRRFESGVLVEVERGAKPVARFLDEPCSLRFLVPNDLRYLSHDCAEPQLATFVPMAVWAFRRLEAERSFGVVAVQNRTAAVPRDELSELDQLLLELAADGLERASPVWRRRWERQEEALRNAGLAWPADLAEQLRLQHVRYAAHDGLFDPHETLSAVGELALRSRAIAGEAPDLPQFLVRGGGADRTAEIAGGRFIGLGVGATVGSRSATMSAYLQDAATGNVSVLEREFADPADGSSPKSFIELAQTSLARGVTLGSVGRSQTLLKSGKRTPSGRLVLPRGGANFAVTPQNFQWEQLRPPLASDSFARLAERWKSLPPMSLRPRRASENLHAVALREIDSARFDAGSQRLTARLIDATGGEAVLSLPFHHRAREGFDALVDALTRSGGDAKFICGHFQASVRPTVQPVAVVLGSGAERRCIQPWTDGAPAPVGSESREQRESTNIESSPAGPLQSWLTELESESADAFVSGLRALDARHAAIWQRSAERGRSLGLQRFARPIAELAERLARKADDLSWDPKPASAVLLRVAMLLRLAKDAAP